MSTEEEQLPYSAHGVMVVNEKQCNSELLSHSISVRSIRKQKRCSRAVCSSDPDIQATMVPCLHVVQLSWHYHVCWQILLLQKLELYR